MRSTPEPAPDLPEKVLRFICGTFGGAAFGLILVIIFRDVLMKDAWWCIGVNSAVFAICAMKLGDPFWQFVFGSLQLVGRSLLLFLSL